MSNEREWYDTETWATFRVHWLLQNPPFDNGCYLCGICGRWVQSEEVTLDHIEPRTKENIYDPSNIQPAHGYCNYLKGSKRWEPKVSIHEQAFLRLLSDM